MLVVETAAGGGGSSLMSPTDNVGNNGRSRGLSGEEILGALKQMELSRKCSELLFHVGFSLLLHLLVVLHFYRMQINHISNPLWNTEIG